MSAVKLIVLYPQPTDAAQFDLDYQTHLQLLHQKANIPSEQKPYTVTKFLVAGPDRPAFYQMFSLPFPSIDALQLAVMSPQMQEVAADATRISTGGAPVVLVGSDHEFDI